MSDKLIITFDKSNEDVPVLMVATEGFLSLTGYSTNIINVITGEEAVRLWRELSKKTKTKKDNHEFPAQTVEAISGISPV